jgi:hypothetical protein
MLKNGFEESTPIRKALSGFLFNFYRIAPRADKNVWVEKASPMNS